MARRKKAALLRDSRSGIYYVRYTPPGGASQERRKISARTIDPVDAEIERRRIQDQLDRGQDPQFEAERAERENAASRMSLRDIWPEFQRRHFRNLSEPTRELYGNNFANLAKCLIDNIPLVDWPMARLTRGIVNSFADLRLEQGRASATVNRDIQFLRVALNQAVEWGYLDFSPLARFRLLEERNRRDVSNIQPSDLRPLLESLPATMSNVVEFAYLSWRRINEVLGLRIEDIHKVHLPSPHWAAWYRVKGGATRAFPLSSLAMEVIGRARGKRSGGYVFVSRRQGDGRFRSVHRTWDRHIQPLEIRIVGGSLLQMHDLRRLAATDASRRGYGEESIAEALGHARKTVTGRYAPPRPVPVEIFETQTPIRKKKVVNDVYIEKAAIS